MIDTSSPTAHLEVAAQILEVITSEELGPEAQTLAVLLRRFISRMEELGNATGARARQQKKRRFNKIDKHWALAELARLEQPTPFSPSVYIDMSPSGKRKVFHRPGCSEMLSGRRASLDSVLEWGFRPCKYCGGVRTELHEGELVAQIEEMRLLLNEIRNFSLLDYSGFIHIVEASIMLGMDTDLLEAECRKEHVAQTNRETHDKVFLIFSGVQALRYLERPDDRQYQFMFWRPDCMTFRRRSQVLADLPGNGPEKIRRRLQETKNAPSE